ncbi:PREDICTED: zinc finger BED domain-containing protein RICESLEEPER 2-like [Tarenaya hassleriana]|uniref:zinc finger BED domain-containing protein RICESLEEPER 2-like n=1 Tax=Tarenaya hassleriana TaxID=28532 RepID=UPI00053C6F53|nr:PREDICTED: zinc finger BED domain-containing protein RICESLEEPER 2-like [Tarenaya hassleriana]
MQDILKHQLSLQNSLLCEGEFFHIRCCAHILNIIVQAGLKVISDALDKIRESVKYVRASEARMKAFDECVEQVGGNIRASLCMDVATRWNSTHMMLVSALNHRYAFSSLALIDRNYKFCPTNEEWIRGEKIRDFLKPFDDITTMISGSKYPTSNLYFMKVWKIEMLLKEYVGGEDELLKSMAERMKVKFDKYWEEYSIILVIGSVLDPRMKLEALKFFYDQLDEESSQSKVDKVKSKMYLIFEEYKKRFGISTSKSLSISQDNSSKEDKQGSTQFDELSGWKTKASLDDGLKTDLDKYLKDPTIDLHRYKDMDILEFWKINEAQYGTALAFMASDILSIPITTVASESSFSADSRSGIDGTLSTSLSPMVILPEVVSEN